jgi:hypothetical protein
MDLRALNLSISFSPNIISIKDFGTWARLGNQMFQYAYLRVLSIDHNVKIQLPRLQSPFGYKQAQLFDAFDLNIEHLDQVTRSVSEGNEVVFDTRFPSDTLQRSVSAGLRPNEVVFDTRFSASEGKGNVCIFNQTLSESTMLFENKLDSKNLKIENNTLIEGYFQSEKYFLKYEDIIRKDFTWKKNISIPCIEFLKNRKQGIKVCCHIRRGDNLNTTDAPNPIVSETFRQNAFEYLNKYIPEYDILIFTDDKEWCKKNIKYSNQIIVEDFSDIEEICLMSMCDHFIIGSSTFSWWGSWLSTNKNKIIIAPDIWFTQKLAYGKPLNQQDKDIIPSDWVRLSS